MIGTFTKSSDVTKTDMDNQKSGDTGLQGQTLNGNSSFSQSSGIGQTIIKVGLVLLSVIFLIVAIIWLRKKRR